MDQGRDYSVLQNARRLVEGIDFVIDRQLGYISLNRRLADSDVLAVAYDYTINGSNTIYKVGELSSDGVIAPDNLVVKLLRSELVITDIPLWDLMMKNIYNLQAYQLNEQGFRLELLYQNDATGVPLNTLQTSVTNAGEFSNKTLLNLFYIDRLDQNDVSTPEGDGYFDFVEGITIHANKGYMMFPKEKPFGSYIEGVLTDSNDAGFVFNELYEFTQTEVKNNYQQKDKYQLRGYFKTDSAQGIALGAFNVPQGSVHVTSGGRELVEGVDYVVDYQIGRVKIINPSIEASNAPIQVSVEQNAIFSQQRRSFFGIDVEHKFSDNLVVGASYLNLREQPFTNKVMFGQEPIKNSVFGFNTSYNTEVPVFTKWVNKLPFADTDMASNFSIRGDVAYLLPGTPKSIEINGEAASYIDDFEGSQIPLDIRSQRLWYLASTPKNQPDFDLGNNNLVGSTLDYGKQRARLAWYNIDNDLHGGSQQPNNIDNDEISRAEVRRVSNSELFPNDELDLTESTIIRTLDLAFYPNERGSYNFDTDNLNADGTFNNPEDRWGGITRPLTVTDFENSNIEYIQFWMMDPFENYSITNEEGLPTSIDPLNPINQVGELYFNLGNISEDILQDGSKLFENGLPEDGSPTNQTSIWGGIPNSQSLLYAFDDNDTHRLYQDIGLDGLSDLDENSNFAAYLSALSLVGISPEALAQANADPSSDNFQFYKGGELDNQNASILTRYKNYNRTQGNSPTANMSPESYPTAATQYPDTEDINKDQTMSTVEGYYQYKIEINRTALDNIDNPFIVDRRETSNTLPNGLNQNTTWYQFRIPITSGTPIGGINGFHSIRFMRIFMTKFRMPVVLRFAQMEMVRGEWRRYKYTLDDGTEALIDQDNFESGVVNIEENEGRAPIRYIEPPGIVRERLQGTTTVQLQNEQSLSLKVKNLQPEEGRSLYKNVRFDMRMFKRLQLFIHAENKDAANTAENELVAIIRIGSDLSDNYYQIEKPLKISEHRQNASALEVWPEENELNVDLEVLKKLKLDRYEANNGTTGELFPAIIPGEPVQYRLRVKGHPNLGNIKTIMLGVKNKSGNPMTSEIWFNELRVSEFDNEGGWAAVVSADANFADLLDVAVTGRMSTQGYGNVDQSVSERSQENITQYDLVSNLSGGKLFPKVWGLQLPLSFSVGEEIKDPKYDAQYQDILLSDTNDTNSEHRNDAQDYTKRTSVSLINFKKNRNPKSTKKQRFYDVENLAFSYAYNEVLHRDYNVKKFLDQNVRASVGYSYSFKPLEISPFKKSKSLKGKYFKLIKDLNFNFLPSTISVNSNIIRSYNEQLSRSLVSIPGFPELPTLKQRNFLFDWDYSLGYKPTKSIKLNFRALNNHVYDDFTNSDDITLYKNFFDPGRPTHYHQTLDGSYQIPISKIPLFAFIKSNYSYTADFDWQGASESYANQIGNTVQNANTHNLSVDVNMKKFYKDIGMTKLLRTKSQKKRAKRARENARKAKEKNKKEGKNKLLQKPKQKTLRLKKPKLQVKKYLEVSII
jgi:cell surface protein SprA